MKLKQILNEWESTELPAAVLDGLKTISAGTIVDRNLTRSHRPFLYSQQLPNKLYIGHNGSYHRDIISRYGFGELRYSLEKVYYGQLPGAVGRFGTDLHALYTPDGEYFKVNFPALQIVAFYEMKSELGLAAAAVKRLVADSDIGPEALVVFHSNITTADAFARNAQPEPEPKPQTPFRIPPKTQAYMQHAGIVQPGQKWWAPTSESQIPSKLS